VQAWEGVEKDDGKPEYRPEKTASTIPRGDGKSGRIALAGAGSAAFFVLRVVPFSEPFDGRIRMHVFDHHRLPGPAPERHAIAPAMKAISPIFPRAAH